MSEPVVSREFIRQHARQAAENGKGLQENPFPVGCQAHINWEHAYWDAIFELEKETA